jgi:hypothetical protein
LLANPSFIALADTEPSLKSDTPKLDLTIPKSSTMLKGGVQHQEAVQQQPRQIAPLSGNANSNINTTKPRGLSKFFGGHAKADKPKPPLKQKVNNDMMQANAQSGVGIIGVKFVLAFNHPPVISLVFPGTPAYDAGLRFNDVIVAVDGVPTFGLSKEAVYGLIVGTPDTPVTVSVRRDGAFIAKTMSRMDLNDLTDPKVRHDYLSSM